jgi:hypothetical protein
MLQRIVNAFRGGRLWWAALDYLGKRDYAAAHRALVAFRNYAPRIHPESRVMEVCLSHKLGDLETLPMALEHARCEIELSNNYSRAEKNYLHCYLDRIADKMDSGFAGGTRYRGDFSRIGQRDIPNRLRRIFPLHLVGGEYPSDDLGERT